jgi:drug/metabolite transporter (DMT)-like permease
MFLVTIFAIVIAFFTIGERINLLQIIGAICVILGIHITKTGKIPLKQEISQLILKKNGRESHPVR